MKTSVYLAADGLEIERVGRWVSELADTGLVDFPYPWWEPLLSNDCSLGEQLESCDVVWVLWPSDPTYTPTAIELGAVLAAHALSGHVYPVLFVSGEGAPEIADVAKSAEIVSREDVVAFERIASRCRHLQSIAEVP